MTISEPNLPRCALFEELGPEDRAALRAVSETKQIGPDAVVLAEGNSTRCLWVILEGQCEVLKATPGGEQRWLADLNAGSVFGEMSFLSAEPHSANVIARTPITVLQLSYENYREIRRSRPSLALGIATALGKVLAARLRCMDEWIAGNIDAQPGRRKQEWDDFRAKLYTDWSF